MGASCFNDQPVALWKENKTRVLVWNPPWLWKEEFSSNMQENKYDLYGILDFDGELVMKLILRKWSEFLLNRSLKVI